MPRSVDTLAPLVDERIDIDNDRRQPQFKTSTDVGAMLRMCRDIGGDCGSRYLESWLPGFATHATRNRTPGLTPADLPR